MVFALQEQLSKRQAEQDTKVYLYAVLMAALSFVATQWRGQGMTLIGIVGTLAATFVSLHQTGSFSWTQFIIYGFSGKIISSILCGHS